MTPLPQLVAALLLCPSQGAVSLEPLTNEVGDPARGRAVVLDRDRGHCLLCHRIDQLDEGFQGTIGPPLSGVGERLGAAQLRARIVDPTRLNPATVMPAYHRVAGLRQVAEEYRGRPILSAREVEDVVAFLVTLTRRTVGTSGRSESAEAPEDQSSGHD